MAITVVTPPVVEPITLAEAKEHLRIYHTEEDDLIEGYIKAARSYAEKVLTWRAFIEQTIRYTLDRFPAGNLELPRPPLISVTSVGYFDSDNVFQTLTVTNDYTVDTATQPGRIIPVDGWPTDLRDYSAVVVEYVAGYDSEVVDVQGEAVGTGDDTETVFNLDNRFVIINSDVVYLDGTATTAYTIDEDAGEITFNAAPGDTVAITADYEYTDYRLNVPLEIKQGLLYLIAHFYEVREPITLNLQPYKVPYAAEALLCADRDWGVRN